MTLCTLFAVAQIGGVFPLLCTPYSEDGSLDCETLSKEAAFVADCGVDGIIWPAATDAMKWLSPEEERRGLEAIAAALDGGSWEVAEVSLSDADRAEVDARLKYAIGDILQTNNVR